MPITESEIEKMNVFEIEVAKIYRREDSTKAEAINEAIRRFPELYTDFLLRIQRTGQDDLYWDLNRYIDGMR